nr:MAG TPA: hypothetical protein [Caudoviricetes sp.]
MGVRWVIIINRLNHTMHIMMHIQFKVMQRSMLQNQLMQ